MAAVAVHARKRHPEGGDIIDKLKTVKVLGGTDTIVFPILSEVIFDRTLRQKH